MNRILLFAVLTACCFVQGTVLSQTCFDGSTPQEQTLDLTNRVSEGGPLTASNERGVFTFATAGEVIEIVYDNVNFNTNGSSWCSEANLFIARGNDDPPEFGLNIRFSDQGSPGNPCAGLPFSQVFESTELFDPFDTKPNGELEWILYETFDDNQVPPDATYTSGTVTVKVCPFPPLPVTWFSFTAEARGKVIVLEWGTAAEEDNAGFTIERSLDGTEWSDIGWVDGNATTSELMEYTFADPNAVVGIEYLYRLRQTDFDASTNLSHVVSARIGHEDGSMIGEIFPNPVVNGQANIRIAASETGMAEVTVIDAGGRVVVEQTKHVLSRGNNNIELRVADLPSGPYFVRVATGKETSFKQLSVANR